jgi:hypothetical protein
MRLAQKDPAQMIGMTRSRVTFLVAMFLIGVMPEMSSARVGANGGLRTVSNNELLSGKKGRIVDTETGSGIADVIVIMKWITDSSGSPGRISGGEWCNLEKKTQTDANGEFEFPDVGRELDVSDRGVHRNYSLLNPMISTHDASYLLTAFKPGFVREGDEERFAAARFDSWNFKWMFLPPDVASQKTNPMILANIVMRRHDVDPLDLIAYDAAIEVSARCLDRLGKDISDPPRADVKKILSSVVRPLMCQVPRDTAISPTLREMFETFIDHAAIERIRGRYKSTPNGQNQLMSAGDLCDAVELN